MFTDCVQLRLGSLIQMWVYVHCSSQLPKKSATVKLRKANFPFLRLCSHTDENIYAIFAEVLIKVRLRGFHQRHASVALQILRRVTDTVRYTPLK